MQKQSDHLTNFEMPSKLRFSRSTVLFNKNKNRPAVLRVRWSLQLLLDDGGKMVELPCEMVFVFRTHRLLHVDHETETKTIAIVTISQK